MSGIFIKSNLAFLCGVTIGLSLLDIGLWCLMAVLYKGFTEVDLNATLSPFWGKFAVIVLWLWIHGLLIAISDYLFQAYVVNCFYTQ